MENKKRLIEADAFLQWLVKRFKCVPLVGSCDNDSESMKLLLAQAPTVDAVEVVRCRDCTYCEKAIGDYWCSYNWNPYNHSIKANKVNADGFCYCGERKLNG